MLSPFCLDFFVFHIYKFNIIYKKLKPFGIILFLDCNFQEIDTWFICSGIQKSSSCCTCGDVLVHGINHNVKMQNASVRRYGNDY